MSKELETILQLKKTTKNEIPFDRKKAIKRIVKPADTFGNHYHENHSELIYVISGIITVRIADINTREYIEKKVCEGYSFRIPSLYAHALTNTHSEKAVLMEYPIDLKNTEDKDTIPFQLVIPPARRNL